MNHATTLALDALPLFARWLYRALAAEATDGRVDIGDQDPADAVCKRFGADRGERRMLREHVRLLRAEGFIAIEARALVVCARSNEATKQRSNEATKTDVTPPADTTPVATIPAVATVAPPPPVPFPEVLPPPLASPSLSPTSSSPPPTALAPAVAVAAPSAVAQLGLLGDEPAANAESAAPAPKSKRAAKPRTKPARPDALPFTVGDVMRALADGSGGRVIVAPFDDRLAPPITRVIVSLAGQGCDLGDVRLVGECFAAGQLPGERVTAGWVAQTGRLANAIGVARAWRAGRPTAAAPLARASPTGRLDAASHAEFRAAHHDDSAPFTERKAAS